jgi:lysine 6-dehydrogenase
MAYRYAVLGAGRQGVAAAYDLAVFGEAGEITLFDVDEEGARQAAERVNQLIGRAVAQASQLDVQDEGHLEAKLKGFDAALSAVPYRFNVGITKAALKAKTPLCDLGGSTETVFEQRKLDDEAKAAGAAVVPDCGLAPGTANVLAIYAMLLVEEQRAKPRAIHMYCGGLPQRPKPPLGYQLLFSLEGLLNEYLSPVHALWDGRVQTLEPLSELEEIEFPEPVGRCEAFTTSGGTSTGPWTFEGVLDRYEYKTVRYRGHCERINLLRDLGLLEGEVRSVVARALEQRLDFREPDLVVLRVLCRGQIEADAGDAIVEAQIDLLDFFDERTGFTAMERTTGYSAAIVMHLLAVGKIAPGVHTPDQAVPVEPYVEALLERGFRLTETVHRPVARKS